MATLPYNRNLPKIAKIRLYSFSELFFTVSFLITAPRLLFNFTRRSTPRRARLPSCAARHLASRGQLRATKPSTTHAITRRDVIYRAIRRRLTRVACLGKCRFLRQWPPTRRRYQSHRRLHASSLARPTAPCTTTTTTARRCVRHSKRQLLADTFHRRVS